MYINIISWKLRISKIDIQYDYRTDQLLYLGQILPCKYQDENCPPTAQFPATITWFQKEHCFLFLSHRFEAKMTKYKNRYWIAHSPNSYRSPR